MKRPSAGQAAGIGGISIAAGGVAIAIAQIELSGQSQPHIWSNVWLLLALVLAGTGLLVAVIFFLMSLFSREESKPGVSNEDSHTKQDAQTSEQGTDQVGLKAAEQGGPEAVAMAAGQQQNQGKPVDQTSFPSVAELRGLSEYMVVPSGLPVPRPAFTERWRHTSDGFEASPLMRMTSLSMPGFPSAYGQTAQIRIGACVGCAPARSSASSSLFSAKLLAFLRRDPVASLIKAVRTDDALVWTRQAGNGVLSLEAVLSPKGQEGGLIASVLLQPPAAGMRLYGRDERTACLWIHIDPCGKDGSAAPRTGLAGWYQRFQLAITVTRAFADFLTQDLGLQTSHDPVARAGVLIETTDGPINDLVDTGSLAPLPGAISSTQFLGYVIADQEGESAAHVAKDLLRQFCDHTLHLGDFESVLESISAVEAAMPATRPSQAFQNTWATRELPVLKAIVKLLEPPGSNQATISQISEDTGIDKADVDRAIEALKGEYITEYQQFLTDGDPSTWAVRGVTPQARQAVGQWVDE